MTALITAAILIFFAGVLVGWQLRAYDDAAQHLPAFRQRRRIALRRASRRCCK